MDLGAILFLTCGIFVNAIRCGGEGKWVSIEAKSIVKKGRKHISITARDKGMGIASADIKNIFQLFYRGHNALDAQIQGSGLGLSFVNHIVTAYGGSIEVESTLNSGSAFTITLLALTES